MRIRAFTPRDLASLTDLTIETFRPFYEDSFRPLVGEAVFTSQHGDWRDDYRREVPRLHAPERHLYVAVAEAGDGEGDSDSHVADDGLAGFVAWSVDPDRRNGSISHLAVSPHHRRGHLGTALCEHAFAHMRSLGAEVVEIGTGGDPFHAPARALYERLGCTALPTAVYYREL